MITHLHDFTIKISPSIRHMLEKIALLLIPLPLLMLFAGTGGIIKNNSPENLATLGSMGASFFDSFEMHTLIIAGAFGITFIIWFVTKNIWSNSEEEFREEKFTNNKTLKSK